MQVPEHYISDVQFFFDGKPLELALYQTLSERMAEALPDAGCSPPPLCRCAGKRTGLGNVWW